MSHNAQLSMVTPSLKSLAVAANGQVFILPKQLSKTAVTELFRVIKGSSPRAEIQEIRIKGTAGGHNCFSSMVCFKVTGTPSFFPASGLVETTYGFLLLLEVEVSQKWHLGVFKQNCPAIGDWLDDLEARPLPRVKLAAAFAEKTKLGRINVRRMTSSPFEVWAASFEGPDLEQSMPMISAARSALRKVRYRESRGTDFAVTPSTSRVQRSGGRCDYLRLAEWVADIVKRVATAKPSGFLSSFAQAIPLDELPPEVAPTSVLFNWRGLLDTEEWELRRRESGVAGRLMDKRILVRLIGDTVLLRETDDPDVWDFLGKDESVLGSIRKNLHSFSVAKILADRCCIYNPQSDETKTLAKWIRDEEAFSITFSKSEYFFVSGAVYFRSDIKKLSESILHCLRPLADLEQAVSEKGEPDSKSTSFPVDSVFSICEKQYRTSQDWICCTDLGDEWADYICLDPRSLVFAHCKSGKQTAGASTYQEVIGQALKNVSRVRATSDELDAKLLKTKKNATWGDTKILRLRKGSNWDSFRRATAEALANPDIVREVHLWVTMLSYASFEAETKKTDLEPHVVQFLVLISSFISVCRETGLRPVIFSRP